MQSIDRSVSSSVLAWVGVVACLLFCGCGSSPAVPSNVVNQYGDVGWPSLNGPASNNRSFEAGLNWDWSDDRPPELWRSSVGTGYGSAVVVPGHVIVLHRDGDTEVVESFDPQNGSSQWRMEYPTTFVCKFNYSTGPYSTPVVDGDRVYTVGAQGQMHCLDLHDGAVVWQRLLQEDYCKPDQLFCVGASPIISDGRLIFNLGCVDQDAGIIALDSETGKTQWTSTKFGPSYATPVIASIHGRAIAFVVTQEGLVALDPASGQVFWDYPIRSNMSMTVNASSPIVNGDTVLVSIGPGAGAACLRVLPDGSCEKIWSERRGLDSQYNSLMLCDGFLYGFSSLTRQGKFCCLDATTGKEQWQHQSALRRGQALMVDNRIVVLGENGHLATFEVNNRKPILLSMTDDSVLETPCYSSPALFAGLLYLRNEGTLLCLDLRIRR